MRYRRLLVAFLVATPAIMGIAFTAEPPLSRYLQERPYHAIDLRTLRNFEFNEQTGTQTDVPEPIRKLDGKPVSVMGMMWSLQSTGPAVSQFQLVYNPQERRVPRVHERIFVRGNRGDSIKFYDEVVRVRGTLHVHIRRNDQGTAVEVFTITDPMIDIAPPEMESHPASDAWIWGILVTAVLIVGSIRHRLQRIWSQASQRRMRRKAAFCRCCGYDLRASTVRCPECGTPFTGPRRFGAEAPLPGATPGRPQPATSELSPCVSILPPKP
jgi:hypothetical protein